MELFSKLFGTKKFIPEEQTIDQLGERIEAEKNQALQSNAGRISRDVVCSVMDSVRKETERDSLHLELNTQRVGVCDSKLGGVPYLPPKGQVPVNAEGKQLRLLAQLRLSELPDNDVGLPKDGILQFWVLDDDLTGLETDVTKMLESKDHAVIYYDTVDTTVTEEDIKEKYHPYCEQESYFPIQDVFGMTFRLVKEGVSTSDFQFDKKFAKAWNEAEPDHEISGYFDLDDEEVTEYIYTETCGSGHKVGGYPMFTQYDPRETDYEAHQILLLQIDSYGVGEKEIMWGDCGVGNFFITPEDLKNRDFSKILYSWDCC